MRKFFILLAALGLLTAACGGDSGGGSCESVADNAIDVIQEVIDEMDSLSLEEIASMEEQPQVLVDMEKRADELQQQADDLGCSDADMEQLLNARAGNLSADGMFGQLLVDELQTEGFFE